MFGRKDKSSTKAGEPKTQDLRGPNIQSQDIQSKDLQNKNLAPNSGEQESGSAENLSSGQDLPFGSDAEPTGKSSPENDLNAAKINELLGPKLLAAAFGEIVSVLMRAPGHKFFNLADLEWMVIPPLMANQFSIANATPEETTGQSFPVGVAVWANVSPSVDQRLSSDLEKPLKLRPEEWKSGDIIWLIDVAAPPEVSKAMIDNLLTTVFKGKNVKMRIIKENGERLVQVFTGRDVDQGVETKVDA